MHYHFIFDGLITGEDGQLHWTANQRSQAIPTALKAIGLMGRFLYSRCDCNLLRAHQLCKSYRGYHQHDFPYLFLRWVISVIIRWRKLGL